jgi:hypothetical protein
MVGGKMTETLRQYVHLTIDELSEKQFDDLVAYTREVNRNDKDVLVITDLGKPSYLKALQPVRGLQLIMNLEAPKKLAENLVDILFKEKK